MATTNLIDIIKEYQYLAANAVDIFTKKYKVNNILEGWHSKLYEQTGNLKDEGLYFYAFHGIGLVAEFRDKTVDFDFAFFPEPRHDGFDLWRITKFIQDHQHYPAYQDKTKIENEFNDLIRAGVIVNPVLEYSTNLYFFKESLIGDGKVET